MSHHSYRVTNNHSVSQSDGTKNIKEWLLWPCTSSNSDPHLQGCYYTMSSVYHPNTIIPVCCTAQWQVTKEWKNTNENKNVSPLNKLYLPWTTSDCSTSTTHFIAHPMACLAGMISIFSSAQHPELSQYEYQKNINKNKFVTINKKILTLLHIQLKIWNFGGW